MPEPSAAMQTEAANDANPELPHSTANNIGHPLMQGPQSSKLKADLAHGSRTSSPSKHEDQIDSLTRPKNIA